MSKLKKIYKVNGMDCTSCAQMIELDLEDIGVKASCNFPKETLEVEFDPKKLNEEKIKKIVESGGYSLT